jgi:hypothetical protein
MVLKGGLSYHTGICHTAVFVQTGQMLIFYSELAPAFDFWLCAAIFHLDAGVVINMTCCHLCQKQLEGRNQMTTDIF